MATTAMKAARRVTAKWSAAQLRKARRAIAALRPGESWTADHALTFEEFCQLTPDGTLAELYEGGVYVPNPNDAHEIVYAFLFNLLYLYARGGRHGTVRGSRSAVLLDDYTAPQPDVVFIRRSRRHVITPRQIVGPPDLIMEIIWSESSRRRAHAKMVRYERFGVPEYWSIDLLLKKALVMHLDDQGRYHPTFEGARGVVKSRVLPGFQLRAQWLWLPEDKMPDTMSLAQRLLLGRLPR